MPLPLSDCVPVDAEGRHGDKDVDRERVDIVDAAKGLLSETNKHDELDCNCNWSNRCNQSKRKIDRHIRTGRSLLLQVSAIVVMLLLFLMMKSDIVLLGADLPLSWL